MGRPVFLLLLGFVVFFNWGGGGGGGGGGRVCVCFVLLGWVGFFCSNKINNVWGYFKLMDKYLGRVWDALLAPEVLLVCSNIW